MCHISLELLLMLDESQKKLALLTVHQQAKNDVLVIAIASAVAKKYQARKHKGHILRLLSCTHPECFPSVLPIPFLPSIQFAWPWEQTLTTPSPNVPGVPGGDCRVQGMHPALQQLSTTWSCPICMSNQSPHLSQ